MLSKKPTNELSDSKESKISVVLGLVLVIVAGVLVFNYFKGVNKSKPMFGSKNEISQNNKNEPTPGEKNIPQVYKIKSGDDLWHISEKIYGSGYNWVDIARENKISNPDIITEGKIIKLPKVPVIKGDINGPGISTTSSLAITSSPYKVIDGDYLWNIAVRACGDGYKWTKFANDNKLENPDLIHPGNILKVKCK